MTRVLCCRRCGAPLAAARSAERVENPTIDAIVDEVARSLDVSAVEIWSGRKWRAVARARRLAIYLARRALSARSSVELADLFAVDHTTILYALRVGTKEIATDGYLRLVATRIERSLRERSAA